jgi:hypothetical protein
MHLVALRLAVTPFRDEVDLYHNLAQVGEAYRREGESLVVFPGLYAMGLLDLARPLQRLVEDLGALRRVEEVYREVGSRAARLLGVVLVPGSVLVARQDKMGELALVFGPDAFMPEAARVLALLGAETLVAPRAPGAPHSSSEAMAGLWQLCQQNQTFGVESGLAGVGFGQRWDGKAALFAPCEATADGSGFLGRSGYLIREGAVAAEVSLSELRATRKRYPLFRHLNPALYRRYLPGLYGEGEP